MALPRATNVVRHVACILTLSGAACVAVAPKQGHRQGRPAGDRAAAIAAARQGRVAIQHLRAELRLVSFGPNGRLRGRAEVWLSRPNQLRYTLFGPHGSPLVVLTCDGATLAGMDVAANRYVTGAATADNFDAWLGALRLHLGAEQWVQLLLGELTVPDDAALAVDAGPGTQALSWEVPDGLQVWAAFTAADGRLQALRLSRGGVVLSEVTVGARNAAGVPTRLQMQLHDAVGAGTTQVEVALQEVEVDPPLPPRAFVLMPPPGMLGNEPGN